MDTARSRNCECGYPIVHHDIFDDYGPAMFFVAIETTGPREGLPVATDNCPNCNKELTLDSTTPIIHPPKSVITINQQPQKA